MWNASMNDECTRLDLEESLEQFEVLKQQQAMYRCNYDCYFSSPPPSLIMPSSSSSLSKKTKSTEEKICEEEKVQKDCPIHLQQAAIEECVRFIDSFAVDHHNNNQKKQQQQQASSTRNSKINNKNSEMQSISSSSSLISSSFSSSSSSASSSSSCSSSSSSSSRQSKKLNSSSPASVISNGLFESSSTSSSSSLSYFPENVFYGNILNRWIRRNYHNQNYMEEYPLELAKWRNQMVMWSFQVVDHFYFHRETVSIAFSYIDRYLASLSSSSSSSIHHHHNHHYYYSMNNSKHLISRQQFQLLSMTALYTAIKIHEPIRKLSINSLLDMISSSSSNNNDETTNNNNNNNDDDEQITEETIKTMEIHLLNVLQWKMNPPTSLAFLRLYLHFIPNNDNYHHQDRNIFLSRCKYLTELAVSEIQFVSMDASDIALAAILCVASTTTTVAIPTTRTTTTSASEGRGATATLGGQSSSSSMYFLESILSNMKQQQQQQQQNNHHHLGMKNIFSSYHVQKAAQQFHHLLIQYFPNSFSFSSQSSSQINL